ncbi:DUF4383 domain-containing protein [Micromonospora sp. KC213]|nr:DUF4383 domain-containing protein [Micromonospora sp. KC213]
MVIPRQVATAAGVEGVRPRLRSYPQRRVLHGQPLHHRTPARGISAGTNREGFGVAGLALARTVSGARTYLVAGGAVYLVLWLYGLVIDHDSGANFVPLNGADNWLHLFLGLGMIGLGLALTRRPADRR